MDFAKNEEEILDYWKRNNIMAKVREKNAKGKPFYFLDGPPFVSGNLHPGQMWVKSSKDIILRYKRFRGFDVHDRAGYDVHGLPIERKVETEMGVESKKDIETRIGVDKFVKACRDYVDSLIGKLDSDYYRFGISIDFSNPYIPYKDSYIEAAWSMLKKVSGKGLLYPSRKPMAYCPHCETVLSQGTLEVEYKEEKDPSIIVQFKVNQRSSKAKINIDNDTYLLVWTTTPWTLPANVAVAANPTKLYVKAKAGNRSVILAKDRLDAVMDMIKESAVIESEFYGSELGGIRYTSPLEDKVPEQRNLRKYHKIISSEALVSVSEGTGLVHIAPGHGLEDYNVGIANGLPVFSPVDYHARYNRDAGSYTSLAVPGEANDAILNDLKANGSLLSRNTIVHSYPHCWRCDTKLVYLATEQWFINMKKMKKKLVKEANKVSWHPEVAREWQASVLENSPDWCISRQRYWGIPLPIWHCAECGENTLIGSRQELMDNAVDKERARTIPTLHRPSIDDILLKCRKCGKEGQSRIRDVIDVWFDSSIAFRASLSDAEFERLFPVDFILEGKDQLRGWFSGLLKVGVMAYGKAPFRNVSVQGFLLDEAGREMHKKLGNYVSIEELLKMTSADAFRIWSSSHTPWLDLQFNKAELKDAERSLSILYNISNLIKEYASVVDYKPTGIRKPGKPSILPMEDAWIVSRLNTTIKESTQHLDSYEIYRAIESIRNFLVVDLSRFYLKIAKKRILEGNRGEAKKKLDVINYVFYNILILISPFTPFSAEKIFLDSYKDTESIFLLDWPRPRESLISKDTENDFAVANEVITAILNGRERARVRLRWPIESASIEVSDDSAHSSIQRMSGIIEEYANMKRMSLKRVEGISEEVRPSFSRIGPDFKEYANTVAEELKRADAKQLRNDIEGKGSFTLHTERGTFEIRQEHFTIISKVSEDNAIMFRNGKLTLDTNINEELRKEALLREFARRVQMLRKEAGFRKVDKISVYVKAFGYMDEAIRRNEKDLKRMLNAVSLSDSGEGIAPKEFEIEEEKVEIGIRKAQ